jgi:HAD superfamily hydrolase (TIGR01509 family)
MPFHTKAWIGFAKQYGFKINKSTVLHKFSGRVNKEILEDLFKQKFSSTKLNKLINEKENFYRKLFKHKAKPTLGLLKFLEELKRAKIPTVLATAGPPQNVEFILKETKTKKYFTKVVNASHVVNGKPHPEIFLKAAKLAKTSPKQCVVFEDGMLGIKAARRAGMKVAGVATSHSFKELKHSDLILRNFKNLSLQKIYSLFDL